MEAAQDNVIAKGFQAPGPRERIVLMRGGYTEPALREAELRLRDALQHDLESRGLVVGVVGDDWFDHALDEARSRMGAPPVIDGEPLPGPFVQLSGVVAVKACAAVDCSLVLRYRLVQRRVTLQGRNVTWDGVEQPLPTQYGTRAFKGSGETKGLSVELVGFLPRGGIALRTYGGVCVPYEFDMAGHVRVIEGFATRGQLADGVEIATDPWMKAMPVPRASGN